MRSSRRHIRIIAGLWLFTTVWPVVSVPLHFLFIHHQSCPLNYETRKCSVTEEESSCAICSFDFCWKFSDPEKIVLHREDVLLFVEGEAIASSISNVWQPKVLLRGPPDNIFRV